MADGRQPNRSECSPMNRYSSERLRRFDWQQWDNNDTSRSSAATNADDDDQGDVSESRLRGSDDQIRNFHEQCHIIICSSDIRKQRHQTGERSWRRRDIYYECTTSVATRRCPVGETSLLVVGFTDTLAQPQLLAATAAHWTAPAVRHCGRWCPLWRVKVWLKRTCDSTGIGNFFKTRGRDTATPLSIKFATLFFTAIPVFLGRFLHFVYYNFALIVSSTAAIVSAVRDDGGPPLLYSAFDRIDCAQHLQKVVQCLSIIIVREFLDRVFGYKIF